MLILNSDRGGDSGTHKGAAGVNYGTGDDSVIEMASPNERAVANGTKKKH